MQMGFQQRPVRQHGEGRWTEPRRRPGPGGQGRATPCRPSQSFDLGGIDQCPRLPGRRRGVFRCISERGTGGSRPLSETSRGGRKPYPIRVLAFNPADRRVPDARGRRPWRRPSAARRRLIDEPQQSGWGPRLERPLVRKWRGAELAGRRSAIVGTSPGHRLRQRRQPHHELGQPGQFLSLARAWAAIRWLRRPGNRAVRARRRPTAGPVKLAARSRAARRRGRLYQGGDGRPERRSVSGTEHAGRLYLHASAR